MHIYFYLVVFASVRFLILINFFFYSALSLSVVLMWVVVIGTILSGLAVYAVYWDCDPKLSGSILKKDELITYFVQEHLSIFQGLLGLFIAGLLGGALR